MSSLPVQKLVTLAVKTVTKPVAKAVAARAKETPTLRNVCVALGNFSNWFTIRVNVWYSNGKVKEIKRLEESKAVEKGSEVLSESIIFTVSAALIIFEVDRQNKKSAKEKALVAEKQKQLHLELEDRFARMEETLKGLQSEDQLLRSKVERTIVDVTSELQKFSS